MKRALVLLIAIPLIWVLFHFLSGGAVLSTGNMVNLFKYMTVTGMLAAGMTVVIGAGYIDLSVGSLLGFLGAVTAWLLQSGWGLWAALLAGATLAIALGCLHGFLVAWLRVPAFIATLSGLLAYMGLKQYLANPVIPIRDTTLLSLGQGYVAGIPICVLALLIAATLCHFLATRTRPGRHAFALGSNREAARYAGIPIRGITVFAFALRGWMAFLAGLTATSQLMAGAADVGDYQEMYAIAACVLGGTSLRGGTGNVWMSLLGAVLMASILNGMEQMGVTSTVQKVILGLILTGAVAVDQAVGKGKNG